MRENPRDELLEKISYYEEMGGWALELQAKGLSVDSIARNLFGNPMFIEAFTFGHFSRRNLVRSYLGLQSNGTIQQG